MGLNNTPSGERTYIGFFGRRNAGKSSLVNAITGQNISVVSDVLGTTTDAVTKSMEILPLGPCVVVDTPGFDDEGNLGELRIKQTKKVLNTVDIAVLVVDSQIGIKKCEKQLLDVFKNNKTPYIIAYNKWDKAETKLENANEIEVSATNGTNIYELKEMLATLIAEKDEKYLIRDKISKNDVVILVTPIDEAAPKGRLILPQQEVLRDILDGDGITITVKETELSQALMMLKTPPKMVITDSQAFDYVSKIVPKEIPLTSFSIIMSRYKGFLQNSIEAVNAIENLKDGDTVLIAEGCTHHRQCNDIGTVKIPKWIKKHTDKNVNIITCSGKDFPDDLSEFSVIFQCGGCMITTRDIAHRIKSAKQQNIPIINYGIAIAHMNGILDRSIELFK